MGLAESLSHLDPARRDAVEAWLTSSLAECGSCGAPVRPIDPRRVDKVGLVHLTCTDTRPKVAESAEAMFKAVAARARRSDWG